MSKRSRLSLICGFVVLASQPLIAASSSLLIPKSKVTAEFVSPVFDEKAVGIATKWSEAMDKEKVFFTKYAEEFTARNQNASAALPWHEKMGISSSDYYFMIEKLRKPKLQKVFDAEIDVEKKGTKLFLTTSFSGLKNPPIVFDIATEQMTIGRVSYGKPTFNAGRNHLELIGRYVPGYEWKLSKDSSASGYIHIGRLQEDGKCLMNLSVMSGPPTPILGSFRYKC
jgi:hypothetical protein